MNNSTHEASIAKAIDSLNSQVVPNYSSTAKEYDLERTTLMRRHKGQTTSRASANSKYHQCLTTPQEQVLVDHIKMLTHRRLPPTSQMVRNIAEEIIKAPVGKNWVAGFVERWKHDLIGRYLKNIDNVRAKGEYGSRIEEFHQFVGLYYKSF